MALLKLKITPDQNGYSFQDGNQVLSEKLDGGLSRQRQDVIGAAAAVTVSWTVDAEGYEYLRAFYTLTGAKGVSFLIDLIIDLSGLTEYEAHFVPGSFGLAEQEGAMFKIAAQLEVMPTPLTDDNAALVVAAYESDETPESSGSGLDGVLDGVLS